MIELNPYLEQHLPGDDAFDLLLSTTGTVHREVKHRRTVEWELAGHRYFIKIHRGCRWREIFKDLLQGKRPVVSARTEWEAIDHLRQIGVPTLTIAGRGERGWNPARRESFLVTKAIDGMVTLEDFVHDWGGVSGRKQILLKRALLREVAEVVRELHRHGMNHRDLYLCHFLVNQRACETWNPSDRLRLLVIDLHRAQIRPRVPRRWLIKDLGGLLFSALDCDLTERDLYRFVAIYCDRSWRDVISERRSLWRAVRRRAAALYAKVHRRPAPWPAAGSASSGKRGDG